MELEELGRALTAADAGRPKTVIVSGEAGIGKTSLVSAAAEEALERGFSVVRGLAWSEGGSPPFWPWAQVLRACRGTEAGRQALDGVPGQALINMVMDVSHPDVTMSAPGDRFAVFDAVTQGIEAWATKTPVMLILEDLHWADEGSWQLTFFAARNVTRGSCLAIVVTCRDSEVATNRERADLLDRLRRESTEIALAPLGEKEAANVFEGITDRPLSDDEARLLRKLTGGNPLYVEELARTARDALGRGDADINSILNSPDLPAVDATVQRALDLLSCEGHRALEVLAVAGGPVPRDLVARVLRSSSNDVMTSLRPATAAGLLEHEAGAMSFRHDLFRKVCYDGIPAIERDQLHQAIAEVLEESGDNDDVFAIADHLLRAETSDRETAARWGYRAGMAALDRFAPAAALHYFDAAFAATEPLQAALRCDLWTGRLLALTGLGRLEGTDDALIGALDAADEIEDPVRAARATAAMAGAYFHRGTRRGLAPRLTRVLDGLGRDHPVLRAAVLAELSSLPSWAPPGARRAAAREALSVARAAGDPAVLANALLQAIWKEWDSPDAWLAMATQLVDLGEEIHRPDAVMAGCLRLASYYLEQGHHADFERCAERVAVVADLTGLPHHQWAAKVTRGCLAGIHGRYPVTQRLADEALNLLPAHPAALTTWYGESAMRAVLCGGLEHHIELAEEGLDHSGDWAEVQLPYCGLAAMHAVAGHLEVARSALSRLLPGVEEWRLDPLWLPSLAFLGWAAVEVEDRASASTLYELLAPYEDRMLYLNSGVPCAYWGSTAWILGDLAALLGRTDLARQHFETALARQMSFGDRPWLAYAKFRFARVLAQVAEPASHSDAERLLVEAGDAARELGLQRLCDQVEQAQHDLERRRASAEERAFVFRRDGDYWAIGPPDSPARVRAMRGFDHIAYLLDNPGRDIHVLELVASRGRAATEGSSSQADLRTAGGGAEPVLDEQAKTAYRRRIEALREDIDEAEQLGDQERAARAREELETLTEHLAAALGLAGRDRRMGSDAERARVAVAKAVRAALNRLRAVAPESAAWLHSRIRTGMLCRYEPQEAHVTPVRLLR